MKRLSCVFGLVISLMVVGLALGQDRAKSEMEKFKEFKPGSDTTYNWLTDLAEAQKAMKEQKAPLMIYFYCPDDKKNAFFFETRIFAKPEFSAVGAKFITVKINSSDEKALGDFKGMYRGRTLVKFIDPNGKNFGTLTFPSEVGFKRIVEAMEKKFGAKASKGDEGEGKKEEKEEKEEKKQKEKE